jgi:hypothetical protein
MSKKFKVRFVEPEYDYSNRAINVVDLLPPRDEKEYKKFIKRLEKEFGKEYKEYKAYWGFTEEDGCRRDLYLASDNVPDDYRPRNREEFLLWSYRGAVEEAQIDAVNYTINLEWGD